MAAAAAAAAGEGEDGSSDAGEPGEGDVNIDGEGTCSLSAHVPHYPHHHRSHYHHNLDDPHASLCSTPQRLYPTAPTIAIAATTTATTHTQAAAWLPNACSDRPR